MDKDDIPNPCTAQGMGRHVSKSLGSSRPHNTRPPSIHVPGKADTGGKVALLQLISSKNRKANSAAGTAQGLGFASMSITLCSVLRHDQVIPRDTQFIC